MSSMKKEITKGVVAKAMEDYFRKGGAIKVLPDQAIVSVNRIPCDSAYIDYCNTDEFSFNER